GLPLDQDVYEAAAWSSIIPLSERSVAKKSRSVDIPDFTRGAWKTNKPLDLTLNGGATTTVRKVQK
ncbi:MAG TPA: acetylgalactosaminidase, partial [Chitinophagaceae bacterium]|nr:acetylgalactosaminidase [Chitinophagaceae bacterium]